ncbi:MAG: FHA domain-containing protein [Blautia wexlerae]
MGSRIKDLDSSFGTYVNEKRIRECTLNIGDMIFIMGLQDYYRAGIPFH